MGEYRGFAETVCQTIVAHDIFKKARFFAAKYVEQFLLLYETWIYVP